MEIIATKTFIKSAKAIAKRYGSFNSDYQELLSQFTENPNMGVDLGEGFRKVRMAISSKGKSGGARVITFDALEKNGNLYLIYAYDKSEHYNIRLAVIKEIVAELGL